MPSLASRLALQRRLPPGPAVSARAWCWVRAPVSLRTVAAVHIKGANCTPNLSYLGRDEAFPRWRGPEGPAEKGLDGHSRAHLPAAGQVLPAGCESRRAGPTL